MIISFAYPAEPVEAPAEMAPVPTPPQSLVSQRLGAALRADYEALQNDLEQAQLLAGDFQSQLAGKSNEVASMKHLLERASNDLRKLQEDVQALRAERHQLANELMCAQGLHLQKQKIIHAGEAALAAMEERASQRIADLETELAAVRENASSRRNAPGLNDFPAGASRQARELLRRMAENMGELDDILGLPPASRSPAPPANCVPPAEEFIEISFAR